MTNLRLDLFGGFQLSVPGGDPIMLTARKARALLAYLALARGRPQPRDKLAALLWVDSGAEQARTSLRQALTAVRKALEEAGHHIVLADADSLALGTVAVDVIEFEDFVREATPAALERGMTLYRGELLEGFHAGEPAFDDWLAAERERLRGLALDAMARLLAHHEQAGSAERAIECATRLLALDSLQEGVHRSLMRLYDRQGRQALALKQYRLCRAVLQRELGVSPEPDTDTLYRAILHERRAASTVGAEGGEAQPFDDPAAPVVSMPAVAGRELRQAAVVLANIHDITAYVSETDPEQVHEFLTRYRERARARAHELGGSITNYIGARLMVVFGVPVAHSNDTERAVRMALSLHEVLAGLASIAGRALSARIGITSGQVLAARDEDSMTITGEPVSIAAHVMENAGPGETLLSNRVYQALSERLDAECLTEVMIPAIGKRINLWRVRRLLEADEAPASRPFVGRQAELAHLAGVADGCFRSGNGQVVLIRGEAGIGKSRLAERFVAVAREHGFASHRVLTLDFGADSSGDPLRALACSLLDLAPRTEAGGRLAAIDRAVTARLIDLDAVVFANEVLEVAQLPAQKQALEAMDAAARQRGVHRFVAALTERKSCERPLVIVVEDVHWAERAVLECLAHLAAASRTCPVILALTVRAENDPIDSAWRAACCGTPFTTIDLGPLDDTEARELAACYRHVDATFAGSCIRRAEGNPLFLDQLLRTADAKTGSLPGSLQSIVLARLDRLLPADRHAVQAAAVLGQRFSLAPLRRLLDDPGYTCDRLVHEAMVRPEGGDYLFVHVLIQQAVYASLLRSRRLELHRRAAAWYIDRDAPLNAEHLDAAGDPAAPAAYLAAARHEAAHYRNERALRLVECGLSIVADAAERYQLACLRGELTLDLGRPSESVEAFRQAGLLAANDPQKCRAWIGVAAALRLLDSYDEALAALGEAENAAATENRAETLARIHYLRGNIHFPLGDMEACLSAHKQALHYAHAAGSASGEARALGGLGDAYYQQGRMLTAHGHFARCVTLAEEGGFIRVAAANLPMLGIVSLFRNNLDNAVAHCRAALEIAARIGDARTEILVYDVLAMVSQVSGDWRQVTAQTERALAIARRLGARRFEAELLGRLGLALGIQGDAAEAERLLEQALRLSYASGVTYSGPTVLGFLARITGSRDRRDQALREGEAMLARGCVSHCYLDLYESGMSVTLADGLWDEADHYARALEEYSRSEPFPWAHFLVQRGRALAGVGRGSRDERLFSTLCGLRDEAMRAGLTEPLRDVEAALERFRSA